VGLLSDRTLDLASAQRIAAACQAAAGALEVAVCIAVSNRNGELLAFSRMDGAPMLSAQLAQDKAWSVASFNGMPTDDWWPILEKEPSLLHGIVKTDRLTVFGGGRPVLVDGELVGAVGVSGGTAEQDTEIAAAGAADSLPS
jgi:glc operon protein GlcG